MIPGDSRLGTGLAGKIAEKLRLLLPIFDAKKSKAWIMPNAFAAAIVEYIDAYAGIGEVGTKSVDEAAIANGFVLYYDSSSGTLKYMAVPGATGKVGTKDVDEAAIGADKVLYYNGSTGMVEYMALPAPDGLVGTKEVDESVIAGGKILYFDATSGKLEYMTLNTGYVGSRSVDESAIADGKMIRYNASGNTLQYVDEPTEGLVGAKTVDETAIADGRLLHYEASSGKLVYADAPSGGGSVSDILLGRPTDLSSYNYDSVGISTSYQDGYTKKSCQFLVDVDQLESVFGAGGWEMYVLFAGSLNNSGDLFCEIYNESSGVSLGEVSCSFSGTGVGTIETKLLGPFATSLPSSGVRLFRVHWKRSVSGTASVVYFRGPWSLYVRAK